MKRLSILLLFVCLMILGVLPVAGAESPQTQDKITAQKYVLDNGLTVLISEIPESPVVSVYAFVKSGSATEGEILGSGITHFLEHMLFKGTQKRGVGVIAEEVQALGGVINAATSFDYTFFTATVPSERFPKALDVLADMLQNPRFDPQEIQKEREVVFSEMRMYRDHPDHIFHDMVFSSAYLRHPYRVPVIGQEELLGKLSREDFIAYHQKFYVPNNMIVSVAGNVKAAEAFSLIKETFKEFKPGAYVTRNLPQEPLRVTPQRLEKEYRTDLTRMSLVFPGISVADDDLFALDVLAMLLGDGESSRLYLKLFKEKKLVRSVATTDFTPMDKGIFVIRCVLDEKNIDPAIGAVKKEIAAIVQSGVSPQELAKAKQQVLSQYIFQRQTASDVAYTSAVDEAFTGDASFSKRYVEAVRALTTEDIKRVAKKYLNAQRLSVVILKPLPQEATAPSGTTASEKVKENQIQKITLENGLTILLRENHAFPVVSMNLVLNGGAHQETAELNGLSALTAALWTKGTEFRSGEQIAREAESLGMRLGGFSGRNSFGIRFDFLPEQLGFAVNLLDELVGKPAFPETEMVKEKEKMESAILARKDQVTYLTARTLRETLFPEHPFRFEEGGTLESVKRIRREDVLDFYRRFCVAGNMVLSVSGDFKPAELLSLLKQKFSGLSKQTATISTYKENPITETRQTAIDQNKEQAMVIVGFQGVDFHHPDRDGLEVLTTALGSPFSGRIFTKVREQFGQAYALGGHFTPSRDSGIITFYVLTNQESLEKVKDVLINLLGEIRDNGVTDKELEDTKTYLKGTFRMETETNADLSFMTALDELYGLGFDHYREYEARIDRVTKDDIKRLARQYLDIKKTSIVLSRSKMNGEEKR